MSKDKFSLLRRILKTFGLSEGRIDELIGWIQTWLQDDEEKKTGKLLFPYHLKDDFLTPAEQNFYRILKSATTEWAVIAPKVSLRDLFFAKSGDFNQNRVYMNKIDRKHVDFLLFDPKTLKPIIGIELDDKSHQRPDRQQRDRFVDGVFDAAGLPLLHVPVRVGYSTRELNDRLLEKSWYAAVSLDSGPHPASNETAVSGEPNCPKCGAKMVLRTAKSGQKAGKQFWGCLNYPQCRGIINYDPA